MNAVRSDSVDFFLGTTTPAGFKGYFEPLRQEPEMQMYLIKSGPGCGKSTLMKRLAVKGRAEGGAYPAHPLRQRPRQSGRRHLSRQARRHRGRHRTPCHGAGRPGRRGAGGEPVPHTGRRRPPRPRRRGEAALRPETLPCAAGPRGISHLPGALLLEQPSGLRRAVPTSRKSAATSSGSAPGLSPACPRGPWPAKSCGCCRPSLRKGRSSTAGTVQALADRYVVFHDDYGAVSRLLLELIRAEALARGYHIITCPCAMHPDDKIDHLFIPALRLAFLTDNRWHPVQLPGVQAVRCTPFRGPGKSGGLPRPVSASTSGRQQSFWNRPPT